MNQFKFISDDAFESLPEDEKDRVFSDIYGVGANIIEETPELIAEKILQVKEALRRIPEHKKAGFLIAQEEEDKQGTNYVLSTKFLLMFLRAERFHVAKAAKRIVRHFDHKLELFGNEKLPRSIVQEDLNEDDKEVLHCGFMFIDHNMDHFGRTVVMFNPSRLIFKEVENIFRVMFYNSLWAMESNENAQKFGLAHIVHYALGSPPTNYQRQFKKYIKESSFLGSAPYRIPCFHHCEAMNNSCIVTIFLVKVYSLKIKARYRHHSGNHREIYSQLLRFGIRVELLPVTASGKFDKDRFLQPLCKQLQRECCKKNDDCSYGSSRMLIDEDDDFSFGSY